MSERILTLFGEEIIPEQPKPAAKSRVKKKPDEEQANQVKEKETPEQALVEVPESGLSAEATEPAGQSHVLSVAEKPAPKTEQSDEKLQKETQQKEPSAKRKKASPPEKQAVTENDDEQAPDTDKSFELPDDWKGDKQYYAIGEVAKLFNVKTSHIRFWTNEFKLKVRTTRKGDRLYTAEQVRELRAIHHLVKERGFTLTGAKAKLKTQNKRDVETIDLKQSLQQLRAKLVIIRDKLKS